MWVYVDKYQLYPGWEISSYPQINSSPREPSRTSFFPLFLCFSLTQLLRSVLWLVCLGFASAWLLPQSLPLAPQSHCFTLYLSCLISSSFPVFFSSSTPPLSLYLNSFISSCCLLFSLSHSYTYTHTHTHVIILFLILSQFGASSLTGTHHFGQPRFLTSDRCGPAPRMRLGGIADRTGGGWNPPLSKCLSPPLTAH